ncbi:hypothetical protein E2C01_042082 [Portunus trituberculatus]|uniref:Uncharacterized protein n=1 Tax=Portunus trituberculatus TaxID=210409 RepID=A0A5B7FTN3_PORTR|nr:hypothetical protein [Portunus trituberculatus]
MMLRRVVVLVEGEGEKTGSKRCEVKEGESQSNEIVLSGIWSGSESGQTEMGDVRVVRFRLEDRFDERNTRESQSIEEEGHIPGGPSERTNGLVKNN